MKILYWGTVAVAAAAAVLFAVSNRQTIAVGIWPVPYRIEAPLYLLIGAPLLFGFLLGEIAGWLGARKWRREVRRRGRRIEALERELAATQRQMAEPALDRSGRPRPAPYRGT
jgi:uncharacterized integral membrane protein